MYRAIKIFLITVCLTFSGLVFSGFAFSGLTISSEVQAQDDIHVLIDALGVGDFPEREAAIKALVASKDPHGSHRPFRSAALPIRAGWSGRLPTGSSQMLPRLLPGQAR